METEILKAGAPRQRSSRRLKYEAETHVFKSRAGDLEDIRKKLAMRPAQICALLKVHPSAWIRWTRSSRQAPPHVYQMLSWYMELQKYQAREKGEPLPPSPMAAPTPEFQTPSPAFLNAPLPFSNGFWIRALVISWALQVTLITVFFIWGRHLH